MWALIVMSKNYFYIQYIFYSVLFGIYKPFEYGSLVYISKFLYIKPWSLNKVIRCHLSIFEKKDSENKRCFSQMYLLTILICELYE